MAVLEREKTETQVTDPNPSTSFKWSLWWLLAPAVIIIGVVLFTVTNLVSDDRYKDEDKPSQCDTLLKEAGVVVTVFGKGIKVPDSKMAYAISDNCLEYLGYITEKGEAQVFHIDDNFIWKYLEEHRGRSNSSYIVLYCHKPDTSETLSAEEQLRIKVCGYVQTFGNLQGSTIKWLMTPSNKNVLFVAKKGITEIVTNNIL